MKPAPRKYEKMTVAEALKAVEGLKMGLGGVGYSAVLERLKQWRLLFFQVDFSSAQLAQELEEFEQNYRGMRELLQWRVDQLQRPAAQQVMWLRQQQTQGALTELHLKQALQQLNDVLEKQIYEDEDVSFYKQDLEFLVRREWVRLKHGEDSQEYLVYSQPMHELGELQASNHSLRVERLEALKLAKQRFIQA